MPLPTLSTAERQAALKKALEVRRQRAEVREKLKRGSISLSQALSKADDKVVGRMKVSSVLESLPGIGKVRARTILDELGISQSRRIKGLGVRQREGLLKRIK
ncbi:MAG: integration host factor, actinobacterial type [Actinomycetota bacterium]